MTELTEAEVRDIKAATQRVHDRRDQYPNCKHPKAKPLSKHPEMLWCPDCWEAWFPE